MKLFFAEKHPALAKQFDNVGVRVEHVFAGQIRQPGFISETAMIIDRRQDRQFVFHSQNVIVRTMPRRDVHRPSAGVHGNKTGREHRDFAIQKWMPRLDSFKIGSGK